MLSDRNAFTTREEAVPGRGEQLKVGEQDGVVWGVILADVSSLTEIYGLINGSWLGEECEVLSLHMFKTCVPLSC